jgi:alpha-tubulin suppressor-like RCC1 family protein
MLKDNENPPKTITDFKSLTTAGLGSPTAKLAFAALKSDGSVVVWSEKNVGYRKDNLTDVVSITATDSAFAALKKDGSVVTWGNPAAGGESIHHEEKDIAYVLPTYKGFIGIKQNTGK